MLIEKQVKGDVVTSHYNSSNLLVSEYNQLKKELIITFKNGGKYKYSGVPATDYIRFEMADSQGKLLNSAIKPNYPYEKLSDIDVNELTKKINEIKEGNLRTFQEDIKTDMRNLGSKTGFDLVLAKNINDQLTSYFEKLN